MRVAGAVLLLVHLLLVCWLTLRPLDVPWVTPANLELFAGIRADLELPPPDAALQIGAGLFLLAPLGVLLPMAGGRLTVSPFVSLARTAVAGGLISLAIELLQTGVPGRVLDVDSLLLNTAGVVIAHLLVVPLARARLRRARTAAPARGPAGTPGAPGAGPVGRVPLAALPRSRPQRLGGGSGTGPVLREDQRAQGPTPTISRVGIAP
ncbi:VanZ family protein [Streptomyces clavuligerus]|nr:VanZ family protein [Streptomyces clavuligerus]ANW18481.1 hypothetical protein BB341_09660 [Streptomyces clavuligerus]AXU13037.1 VanZ family protein [Streptomyces clavuligerus]MBY6302970.1 VanZ family protein [Streptomyces clavuligerus]QCS05821.1 VanZ family protein [Streptomyces clavuligerus]QPJ96797.1 VanZ family protein [Streptomyces clavuligerus]